MSIDEKKLREMLAERRDKAWKEPYGGEYSSGLGNAYDAVLDWLDEESPAPVSLETGDGDAPRECALCGRPGPSDCTSLCASASPAPEGDAWGGPCAICGQTLGEHDYIARGSHVNCPAPEGDTDGLAHDALLALALLIDTQSMSYEMPPLDDVPTEYYRMVGDQTGEVWHSITNEGERFIQSVLNRLSEAKPEGDTEEQATVFIPRSAGRCTALNRGGLQCDRPKGHTGEHESHDGDGWYESGWYVWPAESGDTETVTLFRYGPRGPWWQPSDDTLDAIKMDGDTRKWWRAEFTRTSPVRPASSTEGGEH